MDTNTKTVYTLGPWKRTINKNNNRCIIIGPDKEQVANTAFAETKTLDEQEANACLIAATPDLLEACKKAGLLLSKIAESKSGFNDEAIGVFSFIVNAIIKAEGNIRNET